jgi:site-specific DNA-methyltransferase (adenine-specific)
MKIMNNYNPDVLSCIANLSSDEVFTSPKLANDMLDLLPTELWHNPKATFLDPCSKSGVFLREITKRLMEGLVDHIPDRQERLDHILKNQVFGISITQLTSFLSRRSLYCSKAANGKYSVTPGFDTLEGNVFFDSIQHTWKQGSCIYCGASQSEYDRDDILETHAYQFIHQSIDKIFTNMKFDVIIGNPPYQLNDGGFGRSAKPIYNLFIEQAKKLNPKFLTMIVPSRWFAGGKGLDDFRQRMLNDSKLKKIVDFTDARDCFPGVDIAGGVSYFLWEIDYSGNCLVTNIHKGEKYISERKLNEFDTFIRFGTATSILRKVNHKKEVKLNTIISSTNPFGLKTNDRPNKKGEYILVSSQSTGPVMKDRIIYNKNLINKWKVMTSKASHDHAGQPDKDGMRRVISKLEILEPGTICTGSYIILGSFSNEEESKNYISYIKTKFLRFLVSLLSFSQDITREKFSFVPIQDFSEQWTDEKLYKKYNLNQEEIDFIESMIRSMD